MLYDYGCHECGNVLQDIKQSIHDEALITCPSCGTDSLERIPHGGLGCFVKDVKTIGQLADKNWSKMGHYKRSEIEANPASKEAQDKKEQRKKIMNMNEKQKERYIITGES